MGSWIIADDTVGNLIDSPQVLLHVANPSLQTH